MAVLATGRLPVRLTPLVGRETELGEVTRALAECRLLTLTGPGGAGKTRLALAVATRLAAPGAPAESGPDVAWVELAPMSDPQVIAPTVATRLGVPAVPGMDPVAAIAAHLTARRDVSAGLVLVVLDNCEHLASDVAGLAEQLLAECPSLSILATSREPLGVEGERSWPVPPLGRAHAARLFEDRARLVAPSFSITDGNRQTVAQVCRKLDDLPLAIELAAARMRVLSVRQLAERLDDMFGVLIGGARSAPPRHQALRATLDWSYDLLTSEERTVFRRLATFAGGFSLTAAERVAAFGDIRPGQVLDLLARLADKSLIRVEGERYHLLATIREYAAARLAQAGEHDQAHRGHLRYYTEFAERAGASVERATATALDAELGRLDQEKANLRAATEYAKSAGDAVAALVIVGQLGRYAYLRGHYHEVREWMDQAVADGPAAPARYRARALYGSGRLAHLQCDYEPAVRRLDAALLLYRGSATTPGSRPACRHWAAWPASRAGTTGRPELHAESLELARAAHDERAEASAHSYLGFASWLQGDLDRADTEAARALTMFRALGDVEGTAWSLISLGVAARYRGDPQAAAALLRESLELSRSIGFREGIAWCEEQLGLVALDGMTCGTPRRGCGRATLPTANCGTAGGWRASLRTSRPSRSPAGKTLSARNGRPGCSAWPRRRARRSARSSRRASVRSMSGPSRRPGPPLATPPTRRPASAAPPRPTRTSSRQRCAGPRRRLRPSPRPSPRGCSRPR
jgi:predicted ATPase